MKLTENFFLKLFEGTDKFDYKVVNENWQKIDNAIDELLNGGNIAVLPTVTIERIEDGYKITVTDVKGSQTFKLYNGKSAYQYAQEGGYTGTEAEFIHKMMQVFERNIIARIGEVTLLASDWMGDSSPYSQVVNIAGVTEYSQVDLTPSVEQLVAFHQKDLAFVTENDGGVVTVYAIGQKPENNYTIQVTITEVAE